jgi:GH24 family phage-related lysozyme (muramidase)
MLRKKKFNALIVAVLVFASLVFVRWTVPIPPEKPFWPEVDEECDTTNIDVAYAEVSEGDEVHADTKRSFAKLSGRKLDYHELFYKDDGSPNYYAWTIYECKRREAQGKKGKEYHRYLDGGEWAIGYGNHIRYLSDEWKATIKRQKNKINEQQARAIMVETFNALVEQVKADYPKLKRNQHLAIASLSFNWGYGNFKRSRISIMARDGVLSKDEKMYWMTRTQSQTPNHRTSRAFEASLFMADVNKADRQYALSVAKSSWQSLQKRGDFSRYD